MTCQQTMTDQPALGKDEFERRLKKLALREGMTFATFAALAGPDKMVLQTTLVRNFEAGRVYAEREINTRLKAWLDGPGCMVETDHVNLRRLLVDTAVLNRTSDCAEYRIAPEACAALSPELAAIDAAALVAEARRAALEQRAARKAAWQQRPDASPAPADAGNGGAADAR
ncbi:MAG: DUF2087 domain-containing protein [Betaproteobacteria bacterium]